MKLNENQKVTLTIGQLKRLINESSDDIEISDDDTEVSDDTDVSDVPEFEINDGVLTKYNGKGGNVIIPKGVKKISGWYEKDGAYSRDGYHGAFEWNHDVMSVKLPNGIEEISDKAFYACTNLKKINFPDSLTTISNGAFCATALNRVDIPASVDRIGSNAFGSSLKRVIIRNPHAAVAKNAFDSKTNVIKSEGNFDTLITCAIRKLLTPSHDSKYGTLNASTWRKWGDDEVFARVIINGEEHDLEISQAKEFGDKVRQGVIAAGGIVLASCNAEKSSGSWYNRYSTNLFSIPTKARKFGKTCREWESLSKIVEKFARFKLDPMKCRFGQAWGKRGTLDSPDEWDYIAFDRPQWIEKAVDWIRKTKTVRDILKVEEMRGESCSDRDHSSYYETECHGSAIQSYKFSVITPAGKSKGSWVLSPDGYWIDS